MGDLDPCVDRASGHAKPRIGPQPIDSTGRTQPHRSRTAPPSGCATINPTHPPSSIVGDLVSRSSLLVRVPDNREQAIFEAYERGHAQSTQPGSVGLGLAVSRELARMMGGDVTFERRNSMTRFAFAVPAFEGESPNLDSGQALLQPVPVSSDAALRVHSKRERRTGSPGASSLPRLAATSWIGGSAQEATLAQEVSQRPSRGH